MEKHAIETGKFYASHVSRFHCIAGDTQELRPLFGGFQPGKTACLARMRASIDGAVTSVQPLMPLMSTADAGSVVKAMMPNRDSGFLHSGQIGGVEFDSFTFAHCVLRHRHVVDVSRKAVTEGQRKLDDDERPLGRIIAVRAKIKTDSRRIIDTYCPRLELSTGEF